MPPQFNSLCLRLPSGFREKTGSSSSKCYIVYLRSDVYDTLSSYTADVALFSGTEFYMVVIETECQPPCKGKQFSKEASFVNRSVQQIKVRTCDLWVRPVLLLGCFPCHTVSKWWIWNWFWFGSVVIGISRVGPKKQLSLAECPVCRQLKPRRYNYFLVLNQTTWTCCSHGKYVYIRTYDDPSVVADNPVLTQIVCHLMSTYRRIPADILTEVSTESHRQVVLRFQGLDRHKLHTATDLKITG